MLVATMRCVRAPMKCPSSACVSSRAGNRLRCPSSPEAMAITATGRLGFLISAVEGVVSFEDVKSVGGGDDVAHSSERPQPHGSSSPTSGPRRDFHML